MQVPGCDLFLGFCRDRKSLKNFFMSLLEIMGLILGGIILIWVVANIIPLGKALFVALVETVFCFIPATFVEYIIKVGVAVFGFYFLLKLFAGV